MAASGLCQYHHSHVTGEKAEAQRGHERLRATQLVGNGTCVGGSAPETALLPSLPGWWGLRRKKQRASRELAPASVLATLTPAPREYFRGGDGRVWGGVLATVAPTRPPKEPEVKVSGRGDSCVVTAV